MVKPRRAPLLVLAALLALPGCSKRSASASETSAPSGSASAPRHTIAPLIIPVGLPKVDTVVTEDVHWAKEKDATVDLDETFLLELGMGDGREGLNVTTVAASGNASHVYRTQDPKGGYRWVRVTFDVEHAEIERLVKVLNENGFLHLAERYEGKDLHEGAHWIVHVRSGGLDKYVSADNAFPDALVAIARHVTTQIVDTRPGLYGQSKPARLGADYGDHLWRATRRYGNREPEPGLPEFQDAARIIGILTPDDPLPAGTELEISITDQSDGGKVLAQSKSTEPRFSAFYKEARLDAHHRYVHTATLLANGQRAAVSEALPVITLDGAHALEIPLRASGAGPAAP
jgi:hypothetical protein